jgi:hypothetical protein
MGEKELKNPKVIGKSKKRCLEQIDEAVEEGTMEFVGNPLQAMREANNRLFGIN